MLYQPIVGHGFGHAGEQYLPLGLVFLHQNANLNIGEQFSSIAIIKIHFMPLKGNFCTLRLWITAVEVKHCVWCWSCVQCVLFVYLHVKVCVWTKKVTVIGMKPCTWCLFQQIWMKPKCWPFWPVFLLLWDTKQHLQRPWNPMVCLRMKLLGDLITPSYHNLQDMDTSHQCAFPLFLWNWNLPSCQSFWPIPECLIVVVSGDWYTTTLCNNRELHFLVTSSLRVEWHLLCWERQMLNSLYCSHQKETFWDEALSFDWIY